jgi:hypothetical protein
VLISIGDGFDERGLLEFDLSSIPSSAIVTEATLTLYHTNGLQTTAIGIHANQAAWQEATVTFNNKPGIGPLLDSVVPGDASTFDTWQVTSSVQDMIDGTVSNYGWQLVDEAQDPRAQYLSSSGAGNQSPKLCVTYMGTDNRHIC